MRNKLAILGLLFTLGLTGCTTSTLDTGHVAGDSNSVEIVGDSAIKVEIEQSKPDKNIVIGDEVIEWYTTEPYVIVNNNVPFFTDNDKEIKDKLELYSELDELGRCGEAFATVCQELMPTDKRGAIGQVKPSGWHTVKYDCVEGKYLYNRCHLIGFQLAGENANNKNLITGTRYLNIDGMLEHENMVAEYVKDTDNTVLYRVTPIYTGENLVADGVLMEGYSLEDTGEGVQFCVFAYNVQPGITIDYSTGESCLNGEKIEINVEKQYTANEYGIVYILNTSTKKYHDETCKTGLKTKEENRETFNGTIEWLEDNGYEPCGLCKPNESLESAEEELTDANLADMEYVDSKIEAIFEIEDYRLRDFYNLFDSLEADGYVKNVHWDADGEMFTFEYKCGVLGGTMLKDFNQKDGELPMN